MIVYIALIGVLAFIGIVLGVLQHQGYAVQSTLRTIGLWAATIVPILVLIFLWIVSAFQMLGIQLHDATAQYQGYLIVYFWAFLIFAVPSLITAIFIIRTDGEKLRAIDPKTGETGGWELATQKWENLTVVDYDGNEIGVDGLHDVPWYGGGGWEADVYYPEENKAVTSFYAEYTPSEVRHRKKAVELIQTTLLEAFDAGLETSAQRRYQAHKDAGQTKKRIIKDHEYATRPDGELPNTPVQDHIDEQDDETEDDDGLGDEVYKQGEVDSEGRDGSGDLPTGGDGDE